MRVKVKLRRRHRTLRGEVRAAILRKAMEITPTRKDGGWTEEELIDNMVAIMDSPERKLEALIEYRRWNAGEIT
jgi:hypothetical protein